MKFLILAVLATLACAEHNEFENTAFGYLVNIGIPEAERIRKAEEQSQIFHPKIVGGSPSYVGQFPYQVGLIAKIVGHEGRAVCGGSMISNTAIVTAAHCWFDGLNQAELYEVVFGSVYLFRGGYRVFTSTVVMHPRWTPRLLLNDIAIAKMPVPVPETDRISPISLPFKYRDESFAGYRAVASGFGLKQDGGSLSEDQSLSHVPLNVLENSVCNRVFLGIIQDTHLCTSGRGGSSTCRGDSGGPLAVVKDDEPVLIGVTSFGIAFGCELGFPAAFARVTAYLDFIKQHM